MHTGLLLVQELEKLDALLSIKNQELLAIVEAGGLNFRADERLLDALKSQASSWLVYRTQECEFIGANSRAGGTWPSTYANECEVRVTVQRLEQVGDVLECVRRILPKDRVDDEAGCLNALSALPGSAPVAPEE